MAQKETFLLGIKVTRAREAGIAEIEMNHDAVA